VPGDFTPAARAAVESAESEARTLRHDHIGTEHLLLGVLAQTDAAGARALGAMGVTLGGARADIMRIVGLPDAPSPPDLPLTPAARDALAGALREAIEAGQTDVGPEHVLLALLRERDGVAARVLVSAGVESRRLRDEIRAPSPAAGGPGAPPADGTAPVDAAAAASDRVLGAYALLGLLAAGGPAAALLREHGIDEGAVGDLLGGD
jgi:ATP-dependent Clp protease ATP-binding subunit ClpC